jgi:hypothetical protein
MSGNFGLAEPNHGPGSPQEHPRLRERPRFESPYSESRPVQGPYVHCWHHCWITQSRGQFAGAIVPSNLGLYFGTTCPECYTITEMDVVGVTTLEVTNCTNAASQVDCLHKLPAAIIASLSPSLAFSSSMASISGPPSRTRRTAKLQPT